MAADDVVPVQRHQVVAAGPREYRLDACVSSQNEDKTQVTTTGCLHGGVIENGRTRNPPTLRSVLVLVQVWVHIPGDPQSVQLRNATTIIIILLIIIKITRKTTTIIIPL